MSETEINKGTLIETTLEEIKSEHPMGADETEEDFLERLMFDEPSVSIAEIDGVFYKVKWDIRGGEVCDGFAHVNKNEDGSIDFHTMHYNGGGYWTEVVQDALKEQAE